jgi:hypothetical protein
MAAVSGEQADRETERQMDGRRRVRVTSVQQCTSNGIAISKSRGDRISVCSGTTDSCIRQAFEPGDDSNAPLAANTQDRGALVTCVGC